MCKAAISQQGWQFDCSKTAGEERERVRMHTRIRTSKSVRHASSVLQCVAVCLAVCSEIFRERECGAHIVAAYCSVL